MGRWRQSLNWRRSLPERPSWDSGFFVCVGSQLWVTSRAYDMTEADEVRWLRPMSQARRADGEV